MILTNSKKQICPECAHDMFRTVVATKLYNIDLDDSEYVMSIGGDIPVYEENGTSSTMKSIVCDKCGFVLRKYRA